VSRFWPIYDELFESRIENHLTRVINVIPQNIQRAVVIFFEDDLNSLRRALGGAAFTSKINALIDDIPLV
jgi:hypothetical protein